MCPQIAKTPAFKAGVFSEQATIICHLRHLKRPSITGSEIQIRNRQRIALDEVTAWLDRITHQGVEDLISADGVFDGDLEHAAHAWVHGGFPQLIRVHLAQTFVSLDGVALGAFGHEPGEGVLELRNLFLALAALHVGAFFQ